MSRKSKKNTPLYLIKGKKVKEPPCASCKHLKVNEFGLYCNQICGLDAMHFDKYEERIEEKEYE